MRGRLAALFDVRRISGQLALLIIVSVVLSHIALTGFFMLRRATGEPHGRALVDRAFTVMRLLDETPDPGTRATLAEIAATAFPNLDIAIATRDGTEAGPPHRAGPGQDDRHFDLRQLASALPDAHMVRVRATLRDGTAVDATLPRAPDRPPELPAFIVGTLGAATISIAILLVWATRVLTSPLTRFADVAERFSLEGDALLLPETGPAEIRTASRAFNRMQGRIRRMMEDRTRMLASVSHDLRTPITRLRLRAEFIGDEVARAAILRDLDTMNALIHGALSFLRDGRVAGIAGKLDLAALLRTVADEFADLGHAVTYLGPDRQIVSGRADDLQRAVTNLVENATKYGGRSEVRLQVLADAVTVEVCDDGPGIPPKNRDAMLEPFSRGDEARSGVPGFGLGLSIVRSIAESHGGKLALLGRDPHGLVARLTLPLADA